MLFDTNMSATSSHFHWDHTGDPGRFPKSTGLIVGPRFKETFMPGYPENPDSSIKVSDYESVLLSEMPYLSLLTPVKPMQHSYLPF